MPAMHLETWCALQRVIRELKGKANLPRTVLSCMEARKEDFVAELFLAILPFTVNFHQYAGNAFHQFEMPGRPVSHSAVPNIPR